MDRYVWQNLTGYRAVAIHYLKPDTAYPGCLRFFFRRAREKTSGTQGRHSYMHQRFVYARLVVFALVNNSLCGHVRIEILYPALFPLRIAHPNPIKILNPTPARNCNSCFLSLFSPQIPNNTAKKKPESRIPPNLLGTLKPVTLRWYIPKNMAMFIKNSIFEKYRNTC